MQTRHLAADSEQAAATRIHEDDLVFEAGVGAVGVDPEDEVAVGVVDGEAIAGEEEGGLENGEVGFLFEDIAAGVLRERTIFDLHVVVGFGVEVISEPAKDLQEDVA